MVNIFVIHGKGMDLRGKTQLDVFGPMTLAEMDEVIRDYAKSVHAKVESYQSNVEEEIVREMEIRRNVDGVIINPAAFTANAVALPQALAQVRYPVIEIHQTNPATRGLNSVIVPFCTGSVSGFGLYGYYLALLAVVQQVERNGRLNEPLAKAPTD